MADKVKAALTASEWTDPFPGMSLEMRDDGSVVNFCCACETPGRHALAALALYQQPYGFTREMLSAADAVARYDATPEDMDLFYAMIANIAALLPPEPTDG